MGDYGLMYISEPLPKILDITFFCFILMFGRYLFCSFLPVHFSREKYDAPVITCTIETFSALNFSVSFNS